MGTETLQFVHNQALKALEATNSLQWKHRRELKLPFMTYFFYFWFQELSLIYTIQYYYTIEAGIDKAVGSEIKSRQL